MVNLALILRQIDHVGVNQALKTSFARKHRRGRRAVVTSVLPAALQLPQWVRGPARGDGRYIVFDYRRAQRYDPLEVPDLAYALARVRTPIKAVKFVRQYGMLKAGPLYFDDEYIDGIPRETAPTEAREPVKAFLEAAETLRAIINARRWLRQAVDSHSSAIGRLRSWARRTWNPSDEELEELLGENPQLWRSHRAQLRRNFERQSDAEFLHSVGDWLSMVLTEGLSDTSILVTAGGTFSEDPPGTLRLGIRGRSLLQFCYLHLIQTFLGQTPIKDCAQCRGPFVADHARRRFCTEACATLARVRRYLKKQRRTESRRQWQRKATRRRRGGKVG